MTLLQIESTTKKYKPKMPTAMITTVVVDFTSFQDGVTTLRISARTSVRKRVNSFHCSTTLPKNFDTGFSPCRFAGGCRTSPFTIAALIAILPILRARHYAGRIPNKQSGRGGGIR